MMTKEQVHQAIDRLTDDQIRQVEAMLESLGANDPRNRWRHIPGLHMPDRWPPEYVDFELVKLDGESVSGQLIRERH